MLCLILLDSFVDMELERKDALLCMRLRLILFLRVWVEDGEAKKKCRFFLVVFAKERKDGKRRVKRGRRGGGMGKVCCVLWKKKGGVEIQSPLALPGVDTPTMQSYIR